MPPIKNYNFVNVHTFQELGSVGVTKILQDDVGYMWFASQYGLFRYDGYELKHFVHDPDDEHSLAGNYVQNIYEDSKGRLWVSMWPFGFAQYNKDKENFTNFLHNENDKNSLANNDVADIVEDGDGMLWIATQGGLNKFDPISSTFTHFKHEPDNPYSLSDDQLYSVFIDSSDRLWIGTRNGGVNRFDKTKNRFIRYLHEATESNSLSHNRVSSIIEGKNGVLWLGTRGGGVNKFDPESKTFIHFTQDPDDPLSLNNNYVYSLLRGENGDVWVGTQGGGLNVLNKDDKTFSHYQNDLKDKFSLAGNYILTLFQNREGLIWIGTLSGGISVFDPQRDDFNLVRHSGKLESGLSKGAVTAIMKSRSGSLWVATETSLDVSLNDDQSFIHFRHDSNDPNSISSNDIRSIYEDLSGDVWIGTRGHGLNRFSGEDGKFYRYNNDPTNSNSLSDDYVLAIHQDVEGQIWIATQSGLNRYNANTDNFTQYLRDPDRPESLSDNYVNTLITDADGTMWLGTESYGISKYNRHTDDFVHYSNDPENKNSIGNNLVYSIVQGDLGNLWIGTIAGLNKFNIETGQFTRFKSNPKLFKDKILATFSEDNETAIWLITNGITVFNPETDELSNFIGNKSNCYMTHQGAHFQAADGKIYLGSNLGYCSFYPNIVQDKGKPPSIVFTDLLLLNEPVVVGRNDNASPIENVIDHTKNIELKHTDNVFSIEFAALDYENSEENKYKYRLIGFDQDWINTGADNRRATYTNLSAGTYIFEVRASNNRGLWNDIGRTITIKILPAPWKTWWAYVIYLSIFMSVVAAFEYMRYKKSRVIKDKNQALSESNQQLLKVESELRSLTLELEERVDHRTKELELSNEHLKKTQNQLVESEKMASLGSLVVGVSHEINTPVGIAITALSYLRDRVNSLFSDIDNGKLSKSELMNFRGGANESITMALSSMNKASSLVESFKQVAVTRSEFTIEALAIGAFIQRVVKNVLAQNENIVANVHICCDDELQVQTCSNALTQILTQLIDNTLTHGAKFKSSIDINILVSVNDGMVELNYKDSGIGMEREVLEQIFDPFYTTNRGQQTGLGMHVVYNQVSQVLKGNIECKSTPEVGTEFRITFPQMNNNK